MSKNNKFILLVAILACIVSSVSAQTTSPYSRYGYGVLRDRTVGPSKGMGGIGYGLRGSLSANPSNPASYSKVDSLTFLFDIGVSFNKAKLSDNSGSQNDNNGGLDYITMLMPLSKRVGFSIGLIPISTVGYSYGSVVSSDDLSYIRSFSGSGGLSQVYGGLGYITPVRGLSVGANIGFLFGSVDYKSSIPTVSTSTSYTMARSVSLSVHTLRLDLGAQYEMPLGKSDILTLGAVFTPAVNSTGKYQVVESVISGSSAVSQDVETRRGEEAGLPATYGLGFTLKHNNILVGADVGYEKWTGVKYTSAMGDEMTDDTRFNDRWKISAGGEFVADPYDRNLFKRIKVRGGLNYSNSYLNFQDKAGNIKGTNEYGATIGFGIPIRDRESYGNRTSYVNVNFEYKKIKPEIKSLVTEEYFGVSLNVNINEFWFFKKKVY